MSQLRTFRGWLLDLYLNQQEGLSLWFISAEDDSRVCFRQQFPVNFYAAGPTETLRALWKTISGHPEVLSLSRKRKQDVFVADPVDVMEIRVDSPSNQVKLFHEIEALFPDLTFYDADLAISTRYIARYGAFPLALCQLEVDQDDMIQSIQVLNDRWELFPELPPLRIMELCPDRDPFRGTVSSLHLRCDRFEQSLSVDSAGQYLQVLGQTLKDYDPDILITDWGDSWLIPFLDKQSEQKNIALQLNRDLNRSVRWQKEITYFSYGHIIYRPEEAHLFGRCHIDRKAAMMWSDYSLDGTLEMARVTTLPIEKAARVSPGQGISAMQVITALEKDVLVPYQKRQVEEFKSGLELIQSDRGGMVYQPITGLHTDVAQIDFISMYPAIIILGNISPEVPLPDGLVPAHEDLGVVPLTLKPLYDKRVAIKQKIRTYPENHPMAGKLKERASALKWLLVVCFGFLGYKNARYGRIEAHEAVTRGGREVLLRAKDVAEEEGFEVLHMYVDALWVKKKGFNKPEHFTELIKKINHRTGLTINLDGIYRWVAFLPSKVDPRTPVANRYFGVFQTGEVKVRGLEARRRDTPIWIAAVQKEMIARLGRARTKSELQGCIQDAFDYYQEALQTLKAGLIQPEQLVINGKVSYALEAYKASTAAVRAARQMQKAGMTVKPGMRVRFVYTIGEPDVVAWDLGVRVEPNSLDLNKYVELLIRAATAVLIPFGVSKDILREWSESGGLQLKLLPSGYHSLKKTLL
ncbi:MAG TPA: hypothetical protein GX730_07120 [Chloroflexi bacterium]|nr:hypothetical protein [Chloroflexota bacterium]